MNALRPDAMDNPPDLCENAALFLDIDGTLIDIAPRPDDVVVPEELLADLRTIRQRLGGALALVSGRSLAQIDALFGRTSIDRIGSHGIEWRTSPGGLMTVGVPSMKLAEASDHIARRAKALDGILLERKPYSTAIHYRANPQLRDPAWDLARDALTTLGPAYRLQAGKDVVELAPVAAHKGDAIDRLMAEAPYSGRVPVFIGDDITDESGFRAVNRTGGISIHIGDNDSAATYRLPSPAALRAWLAAAALKEYLA